MSLPDRNNPYNFNEYLEWRRSVDYYGDEPFIQKRGLTLLVVSDRALTEDEAAELEEDPNAASAYVARHLIVGGHTLAGLAPKAATAADLLKDEVTALNAQGAVTTSRAVLEQPPAGCEPLSVCGPAGQAASVDAYQEFMATSVEESAVIGGMVATGVALAVVEPSDRAIGGVERERPFEGRAGAIGIATAVDVGAVGLERGDRAVGRILDRVVRQPGDPRAADRIEGGHSIGHRSVGVRELATRDDLGAVRGQHHRLTGGSCVRAVRPAARQPAQVGLPGPPA